MNETQLVRLCDRPALAIPAARWFHEKWGVPEAAYRESMAACIAGAPGVPQWYLVLAGNDIVGGLGVIENDFHERPEYTPNVCAVYVEPGYRMRGLAAALLDLACRDMAARGVGTLYLLTDHTSFYERCGWTHCGEAVQAGEDHPSRVYVHHMGD